MVTQSFLDITTEDCPKIGERRTVKTKSRTPRPTRVTLENTSANDLKTIKEQDSFLYYSIPEVRRTKIHCQDSSSSQHQTAQDKANSKRVNRNTCIAFECYPDLFLLDAIGSDNSEFIENDDLNDIGLWLMTRSCTSPQ